eukprot:CAMPEP_0183718154 /NCGR_PEP_ID=MMETSP0737-20130205/11488_1 /TAXON_ID=385413 /ORGANISM="Thalassiosira miniscula, Strain CCMP1093" /LENGTH=209 /DNA_ID=CAMNT_0025947665 /DNA_START=61 /DNA_END=690 /DNA_ORIENTATION=+
MISKHAYRVLFSQARGSSSTILHQTTRALPSPAAFPIKTSYVFHRSFASSSTTPSARPFKVLGLQQIAIGSLDKSPLSNLWTNIFGVEKIGDYKSEKENVNEDILLLGKQGSPSAVEVDLMQPIDPEKSPKVHVPPLNHIGLWVDDLPAAVAWMEGEGVRFTPGGIRKGASGHDVTFIHPKGNEKSPIGGGGVLIELVQAPKDVIDGLS